MIFGPLLLVEQIHKAAALVLAIGFATAIARGLAPRHERATRVFRWVVPYSVCSSSQRSARCATHCSVAPRVSRSHAGIRRQGGAPNVLLLVLDTVRAWNLGFAGYWRPTTPKLARWVERSIVFERTLSTAPWTAVESLVDVHRPSPDRPLGQLGHATRRDLEDPGRGAARSRATRRPASSATIATREVPPASTAASIATPIIPVSLEQALRSAQLSARAFTAGLAGGTARQAAPDSRRQGRRAEVNHEFLSWVGGRGDDKRPVLRVPQLFRRARAVHAAAALGFAVHARTRIPRARSATGTGWSRSSGRARCRDSSWRRPTTRTTAGSRTSISRSTRCSPCWTSAAMLRQHDRGHHLGPRRALRRARADPARQQPLPAAAQRAAGDLLPGERAARAQGGGSRRASATSRRRCSILRGCRVQGCRVVR